MQKILWLYYLSQHYRQNCATPSHIEALIPTVMAFGK